MRGLAGKRFVGLVLRVGPQASRPGLVERLQRPGRGHGGTRPRRRGVRSVRGRLRGAHPRAGRVPWPARHAGGIATDSGGDSDRRGRDARPGGPRRSQHRSPGRGGRCDPCGRPGAHRRRGVARGPGGVCSGSAQARRDRRGARVGRRGIRRVLVCGTPRATGVRLGAGRHPCVGSMAGGSGARPGRRGGRAEAQTVPQARVDVVASAGPDLRVRRARVPHGCWRGPPRDHRCGNRGRPGSRRRTARRQHPHGPAQLSLRLVRDRPHACGGSPACSRLGDGLASSPRSGSRPRHWRGAPSCSSSRTPGVRRCWPTRGTGPGRCWAGRRSSSSRLPWAPGRRSASRSAVMPGCSLNRRRPMPSVWSLSPRCRRSGSERPWRWQERLRLLP